MDEKLFREIMTAIGQRKPGPSDYSRARETLCHPTHESNEVCGEGEEFVADDVFKTPIECGSHAYIYNGYAQLGGVSDDGGKVFISGEGLKTPSRAEAVNRFLAFAGQSLDPKTWEYTVGGKSVYVGSSGVLVSADGIESEHEDAVRGVDSNKLKFYVEYIMEMLFECNMRPEEAMREAREVGFSIRERSHEYGDIEGAINGLVISEALLMDALELRDTDASQAVEGKGVWTLKQDMCNIVYAVQDLPTQFKS